MLEHFEVNTIGTLVLFQAMRPLLKASKSPKFIPISSSTASIGGFGAVSQLGFSAYSVSKAALNYLSAAIHAENEWLGKP